jgi:hypothetical protein
LLDTGYYLDAVKGPNWWEYYFERVVIKGNEKYDTEGKQRCMFPEYENTF